VWAAAIVLLWVNSRVFVLRRNPDAKPFVASGYYVYHAMAVGLEHGRLGQFERSRLNAYLAAGDPMAPYAAATPVSAPDWVSYYTGDIGYIFVIEAARLLFPAIPDGVLRTLAFQLCIDAALVWFVWHLFSRESMTVGLIAATLYVLNEEFASLAVVPFYYYVDVPIAFVVLGSMFLACRHPERATRWLTVAAAALALGAWTRASWWPLAGVAAIVAVLAPMPRRSLLAPAVVFLVLVTPQVVRSSLARGHLALSTRITWHIALLGLAYDANPYGLGPTDESVFALTRRKYGVTFRMEDNEAHDRAARSEFLSILSGNPRFVATSFIHRLRDSLLGTTPTSTAPYPAEYLRRGALRQHTLALNVVYRALCIVGLLALVARGGEWRLVGVLSALWYATYVLTTCAFYFVGQSYDNVPEVALFVCMMGLFCSRRFSAATEVA